MIRASGRTLRAPKEIIFQIYYAPFYKITKASPQSYERNNDPDTTIKNYYIAISYCCDVSYDGIYSLQRFFYCCEYDTNVSDRPRSMVLTYQIKHATIELLLTCLLLFSSEWKRSLLPRKNDERLAVQQGTFSHTKGWGIRSCSLLCTQMAYKGKRAL